MGVHQPYSITRELFYRACELIINAQLDKKEAIQVFNNDLKVVGKGWEKESSNTKITVGDKSTVTSTNTDSMSAAKLGSMQNKNGPDVGHGGSTGGGSGTGQQNQPTGQCDPNSRTYLDGTPC